MKEGVHNDKTTGNCPVEECFTIMSVAEVAILLPAVILILTIMIMTFIRNPAGGFGLVGNRGIGVLLFFGWVEFNERWKVKRALRSMKRNESSNP